MKRKNILKFVSLLGIGSFVMLVAASCTSATTPTPNPEPKPDPMPNPPSGGDMNGENTNPGGGQNMMDAAAQELTAAKTALTTLLNSQTEKVGLYNDYAKIKDELVKAYTAAKEISDKSDATLQEVNNAKTTLETAITTAANSKTSFDEKNPELIKAYNALKQTITSEEMSLNQLTDANFETIKNHISNLYKQGKDIITATLDPATENVLQAMVVNQVNEAIVNATSKLEVWKTNATNLATRFVKQTLNIANLANETNNEPQPGSYSFVGYSVDVNGAQNNNRPNWSFAQRKVWVSTSGRTSPFSSSDANNSPALTDVSWIYNLSGANSKYTLKFNYYGPSTGHLYFPYKLVKNSDKDKVALNYKLNDKMAKAVDFKTASSAPSVTPAPAVPAAAPAAKPVAEEGTASESFTSETMPAATTMNEAPTVADINVAKVTLTGLKFGENKIEFSVPTDQTNKVAPMIGNMYLISSDSDANKKKIYDDLFGNSLATENNAVTVDLLKGYSLATDWSIYLARFTDLMEETKTTPNPVYLVGFIGGRQGRSFTQGLQVQNDLKSPLAQNDKRTFTIYVNAPQDGDYYISGSYLTSDNRQLMFSSPTGDSTSSMNNVTLNIKGKGNWTTLGAFNTQTNTNIVNPSDLSSGMQNAHTTLRLKKGLNKVVISGVSNHDTPYIGNLTFTLKSNKASSSSAESSK